MHVNAPYPDVNITEHGLCIVPSFQSISIERMNIERKMNVKSNALNEQQQRQ